MFRLLGRVQLAYLGLFALICGGVWAYEATYLWPMQHCEQAGGWWSEKYRQCATPMPIWRITGRGAPGSATTPVTITPAAMSASPRPAQTAPAKIVSAKKP